MRSNEKELNRMVVQLDLVRARSTVVIEPLINDVNAVVAAHRSSSTHEVLMITRVAKQLDELLLDFEKRLATVMPAGVGLTAPGRFGTGEEYVPKPSEFMEQTRGIRMDHILKRELGHEYLNDPPGQYESENERWNN